MKLSNKIKYDSDHQSLYQGTPLMRLSFSEVCFCFQSTEMPLLWGHLIVVKEGRPWVD